MKKIIIGFVIVILCIASFFIGSRYTILHQIIEIQSPHDVTATIFGHTDMYWFE